MEKKLLGHVPRVTAMHFKQEVDWDKGLSFIQQQVPVEFTLNSKIGQVYAHMLLVVRSMVANLRFFFVSRFLK